MKNDISRYSHVAPPELMMFRSSGAINIPLLRSSMGLKNKRLIIFRSSGAIIIPLLRSSTVLEK